jgi:hypothetical protein
METYYLFIYLFIYTFICLDSSSATRRLWGSCETWWCYKTHYKRGSDKQFGMSSKLTTSERVLVSANYHHAYAKVPKHK